MIWTKLTFAATVHVRVIRMYYGTTDLLQIHAAAEIFLCKNLTIFSRLIRLSGNLVFHTELQIALPAFSMLGILNI